MNSALRYVILPVLLAACADESSAANAPDRKTVVTSVVTAAVDKHYHRVKNKDGSYRPEYYALSLGGQANDTISHQSVDRVPRAEFEALLKQQLTKQNYLMAPDTASAGLLIHVLWGMTDPPAENTSLDIARDMAASALGEYRASIGSQSMANGAGFGLPTLTPAQRAAEYQAESALMNMFLLERDRARALVPSASVLGYIDTVNGLIDSPAIHAGLGTTYHDMWDEITEQRYYLLVYAYDFKVLQQQKKLKPLWVTRVNIRAKGNRFDEQIAAMMDRASHYFGRRTDGLVRDTRARVEIGETEVIGVAPDEPGDRGAPPQRTAPPQVPLAPTTTVAPQKPPQGP